ncbi:FixH family protein [Marinobacter sp. SS21]|uniref:FixH family protein n=1 Tax=Marinobacter sp. SS21 TaxID=2979460 RepID=UPI00232E3F08|nr:FixH family protein [Marinobacter sp. SS21]MDC0662060.1 FixH family protein [Marinobacter sp. SS21]
MTQDSPVSPWYRQPWFWFLLIFPTAAIIWCAFMITMAIKTENAMVTDDYSKEGKAINLELARDARATELGLSAHLDISDDQIAVALHAAAADLAYPYLILQVYHPTLEERDRTIQLSPVSESDFSGQLPRNMDGRWYLDLRGPDNDWRLKGELILPATNSLMLKAAGNHAG